MDPETSVLLSLMIMGIYHSITSAGKMIGKNFRGVFGVG